MYDDIKNMKLQAYINCCHNFVSNHNMPIEDAIFQSDLLYEALNKRFKSDEERDDELFNEVMSEPENKEQENKLTPSESIYGFAAWLTCRKKKITLSSSNDASEIATLVELFCKENELGIPRDNYAEILKHPT